ncbi:major facilitator superfamily domain-containing protein [Ampelomyces quisqualis]|uniref:Major facilitator superfamily domain-containing protein n=1 Tax=Ampelomyces quisqualis TaxID=50730 RepID=A0A6A5QVK7_AMPQU|nr:major facilitator superfamily domain-containing protein [Ampelomyces quisqualis]
MPSNNEQDGGLRSKSSDERTPLLADVEPIPIAESASPSQQLDNQEDDAGENEEGNEAEEETPAPRSQIFWLCYTAVVEPIAFFGIFPYINFMIEKVGNVPKEEVGFYSGLIESLFSATQMCVLMLWGKASDRYGRKPPLIISLVGVAISMALFGMSQSLWQMIAMRCLAGVFAGTVVTVRAMLSENSTRSTQAMAFSYFAFSRNLGLFIGPLLGGALETPAAKYTRTFGKIQFFHNFPYALPGIATGLVALSAALTTTFFVKETLHTHTDKRATDESSMSTWQLLKHPGVARVILIYNYVMMLAFTYTAVNPVFMYTPVRLGGIGFTPELIAIFVALSGGSQAVWLLLVFPRLHKRVGTQDVLYYCAYAWPLFFASSVLFNTLLRHRLKAAFWATAPLTLVLGSGVALSFTAVQLAVNDIAPSQESLGTLNAIVLIGQSGLRAVAPALATSIYAAGVKYHILGGHLFWLILVTLAFGLSGLLRLLPEKVAGKLNQAHNSRA